MNHQVVGNPKREIKSRQTWGNHLQIVGLSLDAGMGHATGSLDVGILLEVRSMTITMWAYPKMGWLNHRDRDGFGQKTSVPKKRGSPTRIAIYHPKCAVKPPNDELLSKWDSC